MEKDTRKNKTSLFCFSFSFKNYIYKVLEPLSAILAVNHSLNYLQYTKSDKLKIIIGYRLDILIEEQKKKSILFIQP